MSLSIDQQMAAAGGAYRLTSTNGPLGDGVITGLFSVLDPDETATFEAWAEHGPNTASADADISDLPSAARTRPKVGRFVRVQCTEGAVWCVHARKEVGLGSEPDA